ncbi:cell division protein FtsL, partial [Limobrevibacterium gyesilva]
MIRPFTCVCLVLAAGSGLYLYQTKHRAQMLDREIARTMRAVDTARQRSGLLRAEYALLNDPSRLAELSEQLLPTLKTTTPGQFSTWADLERRLPAVGAPPQPPTPLEPDAPAAEVPVAAAKPEPRPEAARPESARPEPARAAIASAQPRVPAAPAAQQVAVQQVAATSAPAPRPAPRAQS